ncbi:multicopper oxidase-domain-containing protein [Microdochium bolleyi]|uniref:Multicopper oxidase-domain-containing protein n=1 Tax=Microdochium bolleyi TaxID=196109 RepID=A0A136J8L0_9PEZI|nr:multicopper oxidase-domain-containing protein [Microdochium bolleyi]
MLASKRSARPEGEDGFGLAWRPLDDYILSLSRDSHTGPTTREYNWTITDAVFNPDGVFRPMVLINNRFPGPLVEANDGDTIAVHVHNRGVNATSIHFHGMYQNGSNAMDGTVGVTQCPIAPGSSYTYRFAIRGQSGSYWYHAHHSAQAGDGLVGPVVVHPVVTHDDSFSMDDFASDRVVMVQEHYHNTTAELLMDYLQPGRENEEPVPDSALINGRGLRSCADFPGWKCDDSVLAYPEIRLARGGRHRLRIINVGAFAEFNVQVDQHAFHVNEVDGTDVEHDEPIHKLAIAPAQRYSIVLEANRNVTTSAGGHDAAFWLRAGMLTTCFTGENPHLHPDMRAIIRYVDEHDQVSAGNKDTTGREPTSKAWDDVVDTVCRDLDTTALRPVAPVRPPPADAYVILRASFRIGDWRLSRGFFNETTWKSNTTSPTLHRFLVAVTVGDSSLNSSEGTIHHDNTSSGMGPGISPAEPSFFDPARELILATHGTAPVVVDIAINNFDDGAHPFHLHGHKFSVLTPSLRGAPPPDQAALEELLAGNATYRAMLENPVRRDTVTVGGYEWLVIRVVLDNPGLWALHCHNAWHGEAGMAMQILVRGEELVKRHKEVAGGVIGDVERAMCTRQGVTKGVRPDDSLWFGQFG